MIICRYHIASILGDKEDGVFLFRRNRLGGFFFHIPNGNPSNLCCARDICDVWLDKITKRTNLLMPESVV